MWEKWKESKFFRRMKQVRVNRAVYLSAIVILMALAVVLAITAATNRAKKNNVTEETTEQIVTQAPPSPAPDVKPDENTQPTVKDETIPEFAIPVSGKLMKEHSIDVQVFSQTTQDWRVHLGVDIATAERAEVCAVAAGTVAQIWEDPMMGVCVALSHSGDCLTVYKNLAAELAEDLTVGTEVQQGQLLGYVGDTAILEIAEEPHLHMEMTVKGLQVDPLDYFSEAVLKTLSEDSIYEEEAGK